MTENKLGGHATEEIEDHILNIIIPGDMVTTNTGATVTNPDRIITTKWEVEDIIKKKT